MFEICISLQIADTTEGNRPFLFRFQVLCIEIFAWNQVEQKRMASESPEETRLNLSYLVSSF